jgi:hypothetical protein
LVHYPGEYGPQHVDWFWQPKSLANFPDNDLLLFDKVGLPVVDGKVIESLRIAERSSREPGSSATGQVTQFQVLRGASDRAKSLHGDLGGRGVVVPAESIDEVERFFDTCESVVVEQPSVGSEQW